MKRSKIVVPLCAVLGISSLAGLTAAATSDLGNIDIIEAPLNPMAALRHLENASAALAREHDRLTRLIDAGPPASPPDPCADPGGLACRQVHAVEAIDAQAESFLASVAVLDHGTDRSALERRLAYSTATVAWASMRIDAVASDFAIDRPIDLPPAQYPPDPCGPSVITNVEPATHAVTRSERCDSNLSNRAVRIVHALNRLRAARAGAFFATAEAMAFGHERDHIRRRRTRWPFVLLVGAGVIWLLRGKR